MFLKIVSWNSFILLAAVIFSQPVNLSAQETVTPRPRLVVGIVIDQMKYDYLFRFEHQYTQGGFKRLMKEGFTFHDMRYNYMPTYTGPGHASIYTGTTPSVHGIISNDWYDKHREVSLYCTQDSSVTPVGGKAGYMSPKNLITTTITDELRITSNFKSKVIGIALKDRGAILPAGHSANAAYWYDAATGNWITSTWYMKNLPDWVKSFNSYRFAEEHLKLPWKTFFPIEQYSQSTADENAYEETFSGETKPVFPHDIPAIAKGNLGLIRYIPAGNTFTRDFALEAIRAEDLGRDSIPDFLCVSFSTPDYIGHQFGTHSIELQDCYVRLDRDLESLFNFLDARVGKEQYMVFLTADHAAVPNPVFLNDNKLPGGFFNSSSLTDTLSRFLSTQFGTGKWVMKIDNDQVFLNHRLMEQKKVDAAKMRRMTADFILQFEPITEAVTSDDLRQNDFHKPPLSFLENGFNSKRSGDVAFLIRPGYIEWSRKTGTTHGSPYTYDTHVPLIFSGWKIKQGSSVRSVYITDIAPTLSLLLGCEFPNGCTGKPLEELFK
ncbi:MAG: alkaline phosphatase family protein [Bacteroidia bacterium]|nr:alkaline phosphatase family protein [Bacteroidia bacterium]